MPGWFEKAVSELLDYPIEETNAVPFQKAQYDTKNNASTDSVTTPLRIMPSIGEMGLHNSLSEGIYPLASVPAFVNADICTQCDESLLAGTGLTMSDYLVVRIESVPRIGYLYAVTLPSGLGEYRLARVAHGRTVMRSVDGNDISPNECFVDGVVVGILYQFVPNGRHDIRYRDDGIQFPDWP